MDANSNSFSNMVNNDFAYGIYKTYNFFNLQGFDLTIHPIKVGLMLCIIGLFMVPSARLLRYTKKHAVPLSWLFVIWAWAIGLFLAFSLIFLTTFFRLIQITISANMQTQYHYTLLGVFEQLALWPCVFAFVCFIISFFINHFYVMGQIEPYLEELSKGIIRKNSSSDKKLSDIRHSMGSLKTINYDFAKYVKPKKGVFTGLNERGKPVYIPYGLLCESHVAILGETGVGKGVASQMLLTQMNAQGSSLVLFDPKKEEFLYSVFKQHAQGEFVFIDLDAKVPQFNPLAHLDNDRLYPILESALALKEKGQESDIHRGRERGYLHRAVALYQQGMIFDEWFKVIMDKAPGLFKNKDGDLNKIGQGFFELSICRAIHGINKFDLKALLNNKGVLYIKCQKAKSSSSVKLATKILLMAILDEIENRPVSEEKYHVEIMLDELKFILTERVSQALGSIRSKGGSLLLNYQSNGDLRNLDDATLDGAAISQQIQANTAIKICYKTLDEKHNHEMAKLTGTVIKEAQNSTVKTNRKLVAISNTGDGHTRQEREFLFTENDFLSLPKRVAVLIGVGIAKMIYTTPVKVNKIDFPDLGPSQGKGYLENLMINVDDATLPAGSTPIEVKNSESKKEIKTSENEVEQPKSSIKNDPLGEF